jgi:hypothetical protein
VGDDGEEGEAADGVYRSQLTLRGNTLGLVVVVQDRSWCTPTGTPTRYEQRRTTRNTVCGDLVNLQVISEQPGAVANVVSLPYKEEAAGSNLASPTM